MSHIYVNRSTDLHNETFWIAAEVDEEARKCKQLYLGLDVNGAIKAAVAAGLPREEAIDQVEYAKGRDQPIDDIRVEPDFAKV